MLALILFVLAFVVAYVFSGCRADTAIATCAAAFAFADSAPAENAEWDSMVASETETWADEIATAKRAELARDCAAFAHADSMMRMRVALRAMRPAAMPVWS